VLGFAASGHPLELLRDVLPPGVVQSDARPRLEHGAWVEVAGLVVARQRPETAKGFIFVLLEDEAGMVNVIVRPDVYQEHRTAIRGEPLLWVRGKLAKDDGTVNVIAEEARGLKVGTRNAERGTEGGDDGSAFRLPRYAFAFLKSMRRDLDFYARTERELAAAGVRVLGDYEDAAFNRRSPNKRSFYRLGLSDDGTVAASWFVYPAPQPIRCLVLHPRCGDGRVFVTMRGGSESNVPPPPWLHTRRLAAETRTADAVRSHRERVAAAAGAPRS